MKREILRRFDGHFPLCGFSGTGSLSTRFIVFIRFHGERSICAEKSHSFFREFIRLFANLLCAILTAKFYCAVKFERIIIVLGNMCGTMISRTML